MTRKFFLLAAAIALCGLVASASQTTMQVRLYDVSPENNGVDQYIASNGGVRTQAEVGVGTGWNGSEYSSFSSSSVLPNGVYCVDQEQYWTDKIKNAKLTTLETNTTAAEWDETKLGRMTARNYSNNNFSTLDRYQRAAYLTTFLDGNAAYRNVIWEAIWTFTDTTLNTADMPPGAGNQIADITSVSDGTSSTRDHWIYMARTNFGSFSNSTNWSSWVLISEYTNSAPFKQEFVTFIPEPGAYLLMGTAFFGVFMVVRRNRRMSKQTQL